MIENTLQSDREKRDSLIRLDRKSRWQYQVDRLNQLLDHILPHNAFYASKLPRREGPVTTEEELRSWSYTYKRELLAGDKENGLPANMTYPEENYVRYHRTSGTSGRPLVIVDTKKDWQWWSKAWQYVLDAAEVESNDRAMLAFSFGPFIGFWSAFDSLADRGVMTIPAGGLSSVARLDLLRTTGATAIFCTPSYALHLAEVAKENQIDVADLEVQRIIVAGEPGGSLPSIQSRIESQWNARLVDHAGASEVGPWGLSTDDGAGLQVNEAEFIAEFRSLETGNPAKEGELSELVLTNLGRYGLPVIRYRTGDLVRPFWDHNYDNTLVFLKGGVLGRTDDMMIIRGVNIFPSSIEQILRGFPEVVEFRMTAYKKGHLDALRIEIEDRLNRPQRVAEELYLRLNLKVDVTTVPVGSLPRFEMKGNRFQDLRKSDEASSSGD